MGLVLFIFVVVVVIVVDPAVVVAAIDVFLLLFFCFPPLPLWGRDFNEVVDVTRWPSGLKRMTFG